MTTYREERRADRMAERAADREDERARREEARRDAETRQALETAQRRQAAAEKRRTRRARADARARRFAAVRAWLSREADTAFAIIAMGCAIGPAVYFQWHALAGAIPWIIAVALAVMLESGAWVATVASARAAREGRPTGVYRVAMWGAAVVSASINLWHGSALYGAGIGVVLGLSSLGGVAFWELRCLGRHSASGSSRTRAERRAAREEAQHTRRRRRHHRAVARVADRLVSAAPHGSLSAEDAWRSAWELVHGLDTPGMTAKLAARHYRARHAVALALAEADADRYPSGDLRVMPLVSMADVVPGGARRLPAVARPVPADVPAVARPVLPGPVAGHVHALTAGASTSATTADDLTGADVPAVARPVPADVDGQADEQVPLPDFARPVAANAQVTGGAVPAFARRLPADDDATTGEQTDVPAVARPVPADGPTTGPGTVVPLPGGARPPLPAVARLAAGGERLSIAAAVRAARDAGAHDRATVLATVSAMLPGTRADSIQREIRRQEKAATASTTTGGTVGHYL